jgi:hypothetical protein
MSDARNTRDVDDSSVEGSCIFLIQPCATSVAMQVLLRMSAPTVYLYNANAILGIGIGPKVLPASISFSVD